MARTKHKTKHKKQPKVVKATPVEKPPNPFQVQYMHFADYYSDFITFNYHPFLNKDEALDLAIQLIAHSINTEDRPILKRVKRRLKELEAWLISQLEEDEY